MVRRHRRGEQVARRGSEDSHAGLLARDRLPPCEGVEVLVHGGFNLRIDFIQDMKDFTTGGFGHFFHFLAIFTRILAVKLAPKVNIIAQNYPDSDENCFLKTV